MADTYEYDHCAAPYPSNSRPRDASGAPGYLGLPPPKLSTTATALVSSTLDGTLAGKEGEACVGPARSQPVQVRTRTGRAERAIRDYEQEQERMNAKADARSG